jgi:hypothetical protein
MVVALAASQLVGARRVDGPAVQSSVTKPSAGYPGVLDELVPQAWHHVERHANNPIEADHSQLKRCCPRPPRPTPGASNTRCSDRTAADRRYSKRHTRRRSAQIHRHERVFMSMMPSVPGRGS